MSTRTAVLALAVLLAWPLAETAGQPKRISLDLANVAETDAGHAGSAYRMAFEAQLEPRGTGLHVNSNEPLESFLIATVLSLEPPEGITLDGLAWPTPTLLEQQGAEQPLAVFDEHFIIGAALRLADDRAPGSYPVQGSLRYQACDDRMCYLPTRVPVSFEVTVAPPARELTKTAAGNLFDTLAFTALAADAGDAAGGAPPGPSVAADADLAALEPGAAAPAPDGADGLARLTQFEVLGTAGYADVDEFLGFVERAESGEAELGWFEGRGPIAIVALILIGGMALNLTPCVLPMIPINLAIIGAGARAGSRRRGFVLGSAYGLAMALVYGVLGLIVILTAGTFGTINASPWFNLGIALLFVVLAFAMFDRLTIDFSRFQSRFTGGPQGAGSLPVAFGMGGVAALLAGACVAPVVIQVIIFSSNLYSTGTAVALALPFILGLGMAIPWPIAGAGLTLMPKPGPWMVRVRQAFGVFILGTAVYYGYLAYGLFSQRWVDPALVAGSVQELIDDGWYATLDPGLAAAQADGKLVLVDVWATWCKNCLIMDRTTLKDSAVEAALDDYVKIKFQAEDPSASPAFEVMERFGAIGLPAYAILRPGSAGAAGAP